MSAMITPNESPFASPVQPLHNPSQAAQVVVPQAPLGNVANQAPGLGAKALLAKKLAVAHNPTYVSPTDNFMTPVTKKLHAVKKKQFAKGAKPAQLFGRKENIESNSDDDLVPEDMSIPKGRQMEVDDENPF